MDIVTHAGIGLIAAAPIINHYASTQSGSLLLAGINSKEFVFSGSRSCTRVSTAHSSVLTQFEINSDATSANGAHKKSVFTIISLDKFL